MIARSRMVGLLALAWLAGGCSEKANMADQPRLNTLDDTPVFRDGAAWRPAVAFTVSRNGIMFGTPAQPAAAPQPPYAPDLLRTGQMRFTISCSPCHGDAGYGDGMIVRHGYPAPTSYHTERLRSATDEHLYDVLVNGLGKMPPYAAQVPPEERWAVIAYLRALQFSQHAPASALPSEDAARLKTPTSAGSKSREER